MGTAEGPSGVAGICGTCGYLSELSPYLCPDDTGEAGGCYGCAGLPSSGTPVQPWTNCASSLVCALPPCPPVWPSGAAMVGNEDGLCLKEFCLQMAGQAYIPDSLTGPNSFGAWDSTGTNYAKNFARLCTGDVNPTEEVPNSCTYTGFSCTGVGCAAGDCGGAMYYPAGEASKFFFQDTAQGATTGLNESRYFYWSTFQKHCCGDNNDSKCNNEKIGLYCGSTVQDQCDCADQTLCGGDGHTCPKYVPPVSIEAEQKAQAERIEAEAQKAEAERIERIEAERIEAEEVAAKIAQAEAERIDAEQKAQAERIEAEAQKAEAERIEAEAQKAEAERIEAEAQKARTRTESSS